MVIDDYTIIAWEMISCHVYSCSGKELGQEDCLYLNVFSPDIPVTENQSKLPVLVWFFGTNFETGTSRDDFYGPDRFMNTEEVLMVTVNYRFGVFGFLSLGIDACPGNQVGTLYSKEHCG